MSLKFLVLLLINFFFFSSAGTQNELQNKINILVNSGFYKHANIGISVRDTKTGELIADIEKDKLMIPASSLKLLTTLASLDVLGSNFRFKTRISYDGILHADGTLQGNIYIEGSGDPCLGSDRIPGVLSSDALILKIADDIKKAGVVCLEGNVIADESVFNSFPVSPTWQWNDLGNYYASGAWGLNINENLYNIWYDRNGPVGSLTKVAFYEPNIPNLQIQNEVIVGNRYSGDNAYIFGGPYNYGKRVVGSIPQGKNLFKIKGSLPDPPLFFAYRVLKALEQCKIGGYTFKTMFRDDGTKKMRKEISLYESPDLKTIVRYTNEVSINLYAESILKTLGAIKLNNGSGSGGIDIIKKYIKNKGLDATPLIMEDGSGLSTRNLITPDLMSNFLSEYLQNIDFNVLKEILPAAGERGTVRQLLTGSPAKGKVWLKSGSMDKILTYAGYCETASGKIVSFSVFLNNSIFAKKYQNKAELEKILDAIYRFS